MRLYPWRIIIILKILPAAYLPKFIKFGLLCLLLFGTGSINGCSDSASEYFQGYVEGENILVASPLAGQLESLLVSRGKNVTSGDPLFVLEHANEEALVSEAKQGVAKAENLLADMSKGRRPTEIAAIESQLEQAQASYKLSREEFERRAALYSIGSVPQEELDRARTDMDRNNSLVAQLRADLETARLAARPDLLDAARSDLKAAEDRLQQARWRLSQKSQSAPTSGLVNDTFYREGEFVPSAYPVVSILAPGNIKIRFFVPEAVLGTLAVGQKLSISLDGNTGTIPAAISYISPQSEYTPPVIYSRETRSKLVYMIEAVPAAEVAASLHPGQPVDVRLGSADE
jgi:HlyD family secretion protein